MDPRHYPDAGEEYSAWAPPGRDHLLETPSNFYAPLEFGDAVVGRPGLSVEEPRLPSARLGFGPIGRPTRFGWNPLEVRLRTTDGGPRRLAARLLVEREGLRPGRRNSR